MRASKVNFFPFTGWRYLFLSVGAVTAAMLCKEQGITICGICAVYEIFVVQKVKAKLTKLCVRQLILCLPYTPLAFWL